MLGLWLQPRKIRRNWEGKLLAVKHDLKHDGMSVSSVKNDAQSSPLFWLELFTGWNQI